MPPLDDDTRNLVTQTVQAALSAQEKAGGGAPAEPAAGASNVENIASAVADKLQTDTRSKLLRALGQEGAHPTPPPDVPTGQMKLNGPDLSRNQHGLLDVFNDKIADMLDNTQLRAEFEKTLDVARRQSGAPPLPAVLRKKPSGR